MSLFAFEASRSRSVRWNSPANLSRFQRNVIASNDWRSLESPTFDLRATESTLPLIVTTDEQIEKI